MSYVAEAYGRWLADQEADKQRDHTLFAASSCGLCLRKRVMLHIGVPRPEMTPEQMIRLREGTVLHEELLQAGLNIGSFAAIEVNLAKYGLMRPGWTGTLDAIGHACYGKCGLGKAQAQVLWERALRDQEWNDDLDSHEWEVVDYKTAHPNQIKYTDSLPKTHHQLQVTCYAEALYRNFGVRLPGRLVYVAMGSSTQPYEVVFEPELFEPALREDRLALEDAARRARESLASGNLAPGNVELPAPLPLAEETRKEKDQRVVFLTRDWQCRYCEFADTEWCQPPNSKNKTGDRVGVLEGEEIVYVSKWTSAAGITPPPGAKVK